MWIMTVYASVLVCVRVCARTLGLGVQMCLSGMGGCVVYLEGAQLRVRGRPAFEFSSPLREWRG